MVNYDVLSENTRVWIYQSDQPFNEKDIPAIKKEIAAFVQQWVSHDDKLKAYGDLIHNRFIVLMVDESIATASGCSIDSSVRFIQSIGSKYNVDMFDRLNFTYKSDDGIRSAHREEFVELYRLGIINDETVVFNNLVRTKADFEQGWEVNLGNSWHKRLIVN